MCNNITLSKDKHVPTFEIVTRTYITEFNVSISVTFICLKHIACVEMCPLFVICVKENAMRNVSL